MAGCGGEEGTAEGAVVTVYAGAPVCVQANEELARSGSRAGSVQVRIICTQPVEAKGRLDLAAAGANARRTVEDSRAVSYIESPGPPIRLIRPILYEAQVALITNRSGARAMATILDSLSSRGGDETPREAVWNGR